VDIVRQGKRMTVTVVLGQLSDEEEQAGPVETRLELGMSLETLTPERASALGISGTEGVLVTHVEPGSAADRAGVRQGDVIVEVDQTPTPGVVEFEAVTSRFKSGDTMLLLLKRRGATLFQTLRVPE